MWQKISELFCKAHLATIGPVRTFKNDERGLSGVVVAILLILVAVLAIVLIWGFLNNWLIDLWQQITGKVSEIS